MANKTIVSFIIIVIILFVGGLVYYFSGAQIFPSGGTSSSQTQPTAAPTRTTPKVVEEKLVIPETKSISAAEGRLVSEGAVAVPLVPKSEGEKVIVTKAVLTVKGGLALALPEARKWALDAKLAFVKSLGAITLEGKSSQWQIAFSSAAKGKGYEVVIQGDEIVSKKEVPSGAASADIPAHLIDSDGAIKALQELPQFSDTAISSINLYFNTDGKVWRYALATSKGTVSVSAQ